MPTEQETRTDLAAALRLATRFGLHDGVCNHCSVRVPDSEDRFLINPKGYHWDEVRASDLATVDLSAEGDANAGEVEAMAYQIHSRIYRGLPRVRCILHTHMPYATALTALEDARMLPISQTACMFYQRVAYDDEYNGLVFDEVEGDRIVAAFMNKDVLFLANHGVIVTARDVAQAFNDLYYLERACQLQLIAQSTGEEFRVIPHDVAARTAEQFYDDCAEQVQLHFAALKRLLDREESDYAS